MILLTVLLLFAVLMLFMNAGAEVAFFALGSRELSNLRVKKYPGSERILHLLQEPPLLLSSMLVGNMFFRILVILLCNHLLSDEIFPVSGGLLQFIMRLVISIVILMLFGELLPKVWASNNPTRFAFYSSFFVWLNFIVFQVPGKWMTSVTHHIEKVLGRNNNAHNRLEQIDEAIGLNAPEGSTEEEKNILKGIAQFGNVTVKRSMRSRIDVQGVDISLDFDLLKKKVEEQQYSRFPVFNGNIDTIVGMIHSKDLLPHLHKGSDFDWKTLLRPALFIHEHMLVEDLLKEFQAKRIHFAVVVDEFGGTDGVITMEDILEEIVGEIRDEYDDEEFINIRIDAYNFIFEGKIMINEACKIMNLPNRVFDHIRGDSETVAGLVLELAGEIPKINRVLVAEDFTFTVLEIELNRIKKIKITIAAPVV